MGNKLISKRPCYICAVVSAIPAFVLQSVKQKIDRLSKSAEDIAIDTFPALGLLHFSRVTVWDGKHFEK